ncbi:hypothetical protein CR205_05380 [Alteribacter lacisalsi]|uniref:Flagellar protein n=1 Tax=Alteribacter lacisalsi TaxID=2045244 RepID=A0A2W0HWE5_9BACI|nr:flagellar biosynthetic protein FliO [Alteribacter lacisalsi]PYZ98028.1 hypothetical protein CR205_05380 [Alteribacter lacisalsi]
MQFITKTDKRIMIVPIVLFLLFTWASPASSDTGFGEGDGSVGDLLNGNNPAEEINEPAGAEERNELPAHDEQNFFWLLFQMFLALGFVLLLIYGMLRLINRRTRTLKGSRTIQTIGGVNVGANRSVQIVRAGDKLLIVGVGDDVRLLREIDDPDEVAQMLKDHETHDAFEVPAVKAGTWLRKTIARKSRRAPSFSALLEQRMAGVKEAQKNAHKKMTEKHHD